MARSRRRAARASSCSSAGRRDRRAAGPADAVATAREKFHCPACGAEAHWNPAKQALVCPFCGTESPATLQTRGADTVIVEHDLVAALRDIPDRARGWQAEKISVRCQSCQRDLGVRSRARSASAASSAARRSSCRTSRSRTRSARSRCCRSKISESQARELIRAWYGRQWLAPNELKQARAHRHRSRASTCRTGRSTRRRTRSWTAESGTYYYDNAERQARAEGALDAGLRRAVDHVFDDELVCASTGVDAWLLRQVEPFPTDDADSVRPRLSRGLDGRALSDRSGRTPRRDRAQQMDAKLRQLCAAAGAGRHAAEPAGGCDLHRPALQAHPRAGVAADLHLRRDSRIRWSSTA